MCSSDLQNLSSTSTTRPIRKANELPPLVNIKPKPLTLDLPSLGDIDAAQRAVDSQPPQPETIKAPYAGTTARIPLSSAKEVAFAGLVAAAPFPPVRADAAWILRKDNQWKEDYETWKKNTSKDILRLKD